MVGVARRDRLPRFQQERIQDIGEEDAAFPASRRIEGDAARIESRRVALDIQAQGVNDVFQAILDYSRETQV
jgi:hypothetical protein